MEMECNYCHQTIKDVSLSAAFGWLEEHECPKNPNVKEKVDKIIKEAANGDQGQR